MSRLGGRLLCSASLGALDSVDSAPVCALWSSALQCAMGWFRDGVDLVQFPPLPDHGSWGCGSAVCGLGGHTVVWWMSLAPEPGTGSYALLSNGQCWGL